MFGKIWQSFKINRGFVSPIDMTIAKFRATHPNSSSQQAEIARCESVRVRRDYPNTSKAVTRLKLPSDF